MFVLLPAAGEFAAPVEAPALEPVTNGTAEPTAAAKEAGSVGQIVPAELVALPRLVAARA
jgi:hypothetical protein